MNQLWQVPTTIPMPTSISPPRVWARCGAGPDQRGVVVALVQQFAGDEALHDAGEHIDPGQHVVVGGEFFLIV